MATANAARMAVNASAVFMLPKDMSLTECRPVDELGLISTGLRLLPALRALRQCHRHLTTGVLSAQQTTHRTVRAHTRRSRVNTDRPPFSVSVARRRSLSCFVFLSHMIWAFSKRPMIHPLACRHKGASLRHRYNNREAG